MLTFEDMSPRILDTRFHQYKYFRAYYWIVLDVCFFNIIQSISHGKVDHFRYFLDSPCGNYSFIDR